MSVKNLEWLRKWTSKLVNYNDGQPDQDFAGTSDDSNEDIDWAINEAYEDTVNDCLNETDPDLFHIYDDITWPNGDLTLELPAHLQGDRISRIDDVTAQAPSDPVSIFGREYDYGSIVHFASANTLQWGTGGAPGEKILRIYYYAQAEEMKEESDVPFLIPARFRRILYWKAGLMLRDVAEDEGPRLWARRIEKMWNAMILSMSNGRPELTNYARIRLVQSEHELY